MTTHHKLTSQELMAKQLKAAARALKKEADLEDIFIQLDLMDIHLLALQPIHNVRLMIENLIKRGVA